MDEVFGLLALHHGFRAFLVDRDSQSGFLREIEGVGALFELETLVGQDAAQLVRLIGGQGHGVGAKRRHVGRIFSDGRKKTTAESAEGAEGKKAFPMLRVLRVLCGSKFLSFLVSCRREQ